MICEGSQGYTVQERVEASMARQPLGEYLVKQVSPGEIGNQCRTCISVFFYQSGKKVGFLSHKNYGNTSHTAEICQSLEKRWAKTLPCQSQESCTHHSKTPLHR